MTDTIQDLIARRDSARAAAICSPGHENLVLLREARVKAKLAKQPAVVAELSGQIDALKGQLFAEVDAAQAALSAARKAERDAASRQQTELLSKLSADELSERLASLSAQRKMLKREMRATRVALDQKSAMERLDKLVASMSPEELAVFKQRLAQP